MDAPVDAWTPRRPQSIEMGLAYDHDAAADLARKTWARAVESARQNQPRRRRLADRSRGCRWIDGLWCPILPSPRQTVLRGLARKTHGRFGKLRSVEVRERFDVEDPVATPLDGTRYDRYHSTGQTEVEIRCFGSELVACCSGVIIDLQIKSALRVGCPGGSVLGAKGTVADAGWNDALRIGPCQCETDVAAMAASVNDPRGSRIGHGEALLACSREPEDIMPEFGQQLSKIADRL